MDSYINVCEDIELLVNIYEQMQLNFQNSILPDRSCGVIWIITLLTEQNKPALCGRDNLEECVIRQWLEYIMIKFLRHCDTDDTVHKLLGVCRNYFYIYKS